MAEAAGDLGVRSGIVVVPQTFGSSVNAHPRLHAIASRGAWTRDRTWVLASWNTGDSHRDAAHAEMLATIDGWANALYSS